MTTQKNPRLHDKSYLAWLRLRPCVTCGNSPCDAAHIRSGSLEYNKPPTGMAEKPSDCWAVSLCRSCHNKQHGQNELAWWSSHGINPFELAISLYRKFGGSGGKPRKPREIKPRKPPHLRQKIQSRGFQK
jgi:hypothetical protein